MNCIPMLSISFAENSTLKYYYEYRADKHGIPVLIESPTGETELLRLSLLWTGSDGDTLYEAERCSLWICLISL